jgi:hypothetical protein
VRAAGSPCDSPGWQVPPRLEFAAGPGVRVRVSVGAPELPNCWTPVRIERLKGPGVETLMTIQEGRASARAFRSRGSWFVFVRVSELTGTHEFFSAYLYQARRDGTMVPVALAPGAACRGRELPALTEPTQSASYSLRGTALQFDSPIWRDGDKPNFPSGGRESVRLALVPKRGGGFILRVVSCKEDHRR